MSNKLDERALNCGVLPDADGHYVQLFDPDGEVIDGSQLTGKVLDSDVIIDTIDFTPKGCFRAPDRGFVIIRSQDLKLSSSLDAKELQTTLKLVLKEDKAFRLLPSEPLKDRRPYFGQTFYFVDPGYVLNFYSDDNLKNVEIEYCIDEIKDPKIFDFGPIDCLLPKYYFLNNLPRLEKGLWSVRYRKQTELGNLPWNRYLLAVKVKCEGILRDLEVIATARCTDIDNLDIKGPGSLERLEYLSKVTGNLRLEANDSKSLRGIHNIS
ncbi:MAG: hypothetical protein M3Q07_22800, partial [Pseudobdellovibrionaceae bacterium]|nr:hypothetical protein [Pseudobdellovibrionaceae bacterium]